MRVKNYTTRNEALKVQCRLKRNDEEWWGVMRSDEEWWGVMRNDKSATQKPWPYVCDGMKPWTRKHCKCEEQNIYVSERISGEIFFLWDFLVERTFSHPKIPKKKFLPFSYDRYNNTGRIEGWKWNVQFLWTLINWQLRIRRKFSHRKAYKGVVHKSQRTNVSIDLFITTLYDGIFFTSRMWSTS